MMREPVELTELIRNPAARRLWMLYSALNSLPFEHALELARAAEGFIAGSAPETLADSPSGAAASDVEAGQTPPEKHDEILEVFVAAEPRPARERAPLALTADQRERLLMKIASGAKNAELAQEFGLSPKQVQGIRIGCAAEIARRRALLQNEAHPPQQQAPFIALIDDIVRYLRQQDDVVVLQENGEYLINGRFRVTRAELVIRANRMRSRQGKPPFEVGNGVFGEPSPKSHPLFWEEPGATASVRLNGSHQPD